MAPSQLKQLKQSLRDNGVLGPQKSKKQRKSTAKDAQKRLQRNAALEGIRDRFNPFEVKAPARKEKYQVASSRVTKSSINRPGVTRGMGEERRRDTLLKEMQSRNKVGGMVDRRFGEDDPNMTPEQKAAERFARQSERKARKSSMFNLEDESEEEVALTHGGRSLDFGPSGQDDFDEDDIGPSDEDEDRPSKRLRLAAEDADEEEDDGLPQRRKTKNEVMKEVIAKSKLYKAERQAAKADDDEIRAELDKGMSEFYEALRSHKPPEKKPLPERTPADDPHMDPSRAAMLAGKSRKDAEKEYEANLRQLKLDARSKPSVRTKTDEEKATEEAARLEDLERKRIRRMKGEPDSSEDEQGGQLGPDEDLEREEDDDDDDDDDDAQAFGLSAPQNATLPRRELDVEDEDEFVLDDDLIASDSDVDMASEQDEDVSSSESEGEDDGDDDFINGLVLPKDAKPAIKVNKADQKPGSSALAYTFPCPQTHQEFMEITKETDIRDLPIVVQRIRALYHKGLAEGNQDKLDIFGGILTQHVAYLADHHVDVPFSVLDLLIRHLHSMAKGSPQAIGAAFRKHLEVVSENRPLSLTPGDLIILTGISAIFPTSDHFHSVVTPAMLTIARYLGQSPIQSLQDLGKGAYCCSLALQYQGFAKRYVPEVVTYLVNAIAIIAPVPLPVKDIADQPLLVPIRLPAESLRIKTADVTLDVAKLSFKDLVMTRGKPATDAQAVALLNTLIRLIFQATNLWSSKSSSPEILSPMIQVISHISSITTKLPSQTISLAKSTLKTLQSRQDANIDTRRPLLLHNHRPLAIKTSIPQFIENYNPDRHYDPDRERADLAKLKAEHKKERKGAMRELRKDASFMAREQLREKKERDAAYEKKYKKLVAEIQGEEGREAKEYEREKAKRKGRF